MRIISLSPYLTELLPSLGVADKLSATVWTGDLPESMARAERLTLTSGEVPDGVAETIQTLVSNGVLSRAQLKKLAPTHLLVTPWHLDPKLVNEGAASESLSQLLGFPAHVVAIAPRTLEQVYAAPVTLGEALGVTAKGRDFANRLKAQFMDWGDNFYDRTHNKKVCFLTSVDPLTLGGLWIPGLIRAVSGFALDRENGQAGRVVQWQEIVAFRPDVIIIAPPHKTLPEVMSLLPSFQARDHWEDIPAVKRGEVAFVAGGEAFLTPGPGLIDAFAILVSSVAGLEPGYIAPRDSFARLRWVELHRHKVKSTK